MCCVNLGIHPHLPKDRPMQIRRVVTGHGPSGRAVFASDSLVDGTRVQLMPGFEIHRLWGGDGTPVFPYDGSPLEYDSYFPDKGGFRFAHIRIPPTAEAPPAVEDEDGALAEMEEKLPGLLATMEPDAPGMHTTDTLDMIYVVSGCLVLELDDGVELELKAGDTVIQNGTRHRWHNRGPTPADIVGVAIGAMRSSRAGGVEGP